MPVEQHDLGRMLVNLFVLYAAARLAGALFVRLRQPAVVGEILAGVIVGPHALNLLPQSPAVAAFEDLFAHLGVVFLLFIVGLQTEPVDLWRVGGAATSVGTLGIVLPFGFGYLLMVALGYPQNEALFVGTALTATSVGITARVLADLHLLRARVAHIIMGAAVFDDILGMVVLAIVSGATAGAIGGAGLLLLVAETVAFLALAVFLGRPAVHRLTPRFSRLNGNGESTVFALAITLCFGFSALAETIGLAAIIGAFLAGILFAETDEAESLRRSMEPIYQLLVPIFFVLMGAQVDLQALATGPLLGLGLVVTVLAVAGKVIGCGIGALPFAKRDALAIGIGMSPRGEVGLVVASLGLSRGVVGLDIYSVIILMCILTSVLTPPLLRPLLARRRREWEEEGPGMEGRP